MQDKVTPEQCREKLRCQKQVSLNYLIYVHHLFQKISPDSQVAATLYCLSYVGPMKKTANSFGIEKRTVSCIVKSVTEMLGPKFIKLPLAEAEVKQLPCCFKRVYT